MRILIFSDIHGDTRALERIVATPADLYISAGDLSTFGRALERCGEMLRPLGEKLWVIPGNHETAEQNTAFCKKFGFVDFHRQVRALEGKNGVTQWAGLGYSNPTPFNTPGEFSEEEIAEA
ncbi:MAG: metallophosphoesterase, partial [Acidobacteria bacterium]|nr:metallophosphoesterase [Acidobacteriota bacterium]